MECHLFNILSIAFYFFVSSWWKQVIDMMPYPERNQPKKKKFKRKVLKVKCVWNWTKKKNRFNNSTQASQSNYYKRSANRFNETRILLDEEKTMMRDAVIAWFQCYFSSYFDCYPLWYARKPPNKERKQIWMSSETTNVCTSNIHWNSAFVFSLSTSVVYLLSICIFQNGLIQNKYMFRIWLIRAGIQKQEFIMQSSMHITNCFGAATMYILIAQSERWKKKNITDLLITRKVFHFFQYFIYKTIYAMVWFLYISFFNQFDGFCC